MVNLLRLVPKNYLSFFTGFFAYIPLPRPFNLILNKWFVARYGIQMHEATKDIGEYPSIGALFTRDLKKGARSIGIEPCSPVDGTLRNGGRLTAEGSIEQIKGQSYTLTELLGCELEAKRFSDGHFFNLYLSPKDYHHVHSPVTATIRKRVHIPGKLWPVNDWSLHTIPKLFVINERVVVYLTTAFGEVAVVLVGATNVGKISLTFENLMTNMRPWETKEINTKIFSLEDGLARPLIKAGDRLGTFHLGSTVILLFERSYVDQLTQIMDPSSRQMRFGEPLLDLR